MGINLTSELAFFSSSLTSNHFDVPMILVFYMNCSVVGTGIELGKRHILLEFDSVFVYRPAWASDQTLTIFSFLVSKNEYNCTTSFSYWDY